MFSVCLDQPHWIESKAKGIDAGTADRYVTALELHILPVLGDYYFDALTSMAVQEWFNGASRKINPTKSKPYDSHTVFGSWKVLRTMVRDAVEQLGLPRDPTRRIIIPELEAKGGNALTAERLAKLLIIVRERLPEHFAYVATRASTGMRARHVTDEMREHYSTVLLDEKRAAVASALRLLPGGGESADNGAAAGTPANDISEAGATKAAKRDGFR